MQRRLGIQQLEQREMKAGDVAVFLSPADSRDLVIQGDGQANSVVIEEVGEDRIRVSGRTTGPFGTLPTLINGSTRPVEFIVTDDLFVSMEEGNDRVAINGLNMKNFGHSDLNILMGAGNDRVAVEFSFIGDDASIDMGSGDDRFFAKELHPFDELNVNSGDGRDSLDLYSSSAVNISLFGGGGGDFGLLDGNAANNLVVSMGAGDDSLFLAENRALDVDLFGEAGDDKLHTSLWWWRGNSFNAGANSSSFEHHGVLPY